MANDFTFDARDGFTGSAGKKLVKAYMRGGAAKRPQLVDEVRDIQYSEVAHTKKATGKTRDAAFAKGGTVQSIQLAKSKTVSKFAKAKPETKFKSGGKVEKVMHEWKSGELHSGSKKGPVVKNRQQAIAIALSEARKAKK
jgi:hypothetical protein